MNTRLRGLISLGVGLLLAAVFCGILPFVFLPSLGIGMALPVIQVPGEVLVEGGWFGMNLTNTIMGTLAADAIILLFAFFAWRASKGWTKEVPNKFQALAETLIEMLYNFGKGIAGDRIHTKRPVPLWPLVATIFFFLLAANLFKLVPGVESVGIMHCAHADLNGYPMIQGAVSTLFVDSPLNVGTLQTEEGYAACKNFFNGDFNKYYPSGFESQSVAQIQEQAKGYEEIIARYNGIDPSALTEDAKVELARAQTYVSLAPARIEALQSLETVGSEIDSLKVNITLMEAAANAPVVEVPEVEAEAVETEATETEAAEGEETTEAVAPTAPLVYDEAALNALVQQLDALEDQRNLAVSQARFPGATLPLTQEQLDRGAVPYIFHITPFFRGAATDTSLTFALAIVSVVLVQAFGVAALGPAYFEKFINLTALGNAGKRPLGVIDFVVGLIEIISEIGKIVSLAFRLFGNLFAGGVALVAISFLVSLIVPGIIYGLELIIGTVQALVFSVLTLVFASQAMDSHAHHDEEHGHEEEHAH